MDPFAFWREIPVAQSFLQAVWPVLLFIFVAAVGMAIFGEWMRNPRMGKRGRMTAEEKGKKGEEKMRAILARLSPNQFLLRFNLHLPVHGKSTEVDAVVFSRFGIFVIEGKDWSGDVYGEQDDKFWTVRYSGGKHDKVNPLRQNDRHITALQAVTGLPRGAFHSLVVFTDNAKFKDVLPDNVIHLDELKSYIASRREEILSEGDVTQAIADTMRAEDNAPDAAERHKESLRSRRR